MTEPRRGRVLMIVDNAITSDSRVQKAAKSAAEHGWDVTLLGRKMKKGELGKYMIGDAKVLRVLVPHVLYHRRYEYRRAGLRSPLAYPPGKLATYREQEVRAWKADLRFRQALLASDRSNPLLKTWLALCLFGAKVSGRWVAYRAGRTEAVRIHRTTVDHPIDKFTLWFWKKALGKRAWRRLDPGVWDWELAFGPVIDRIRPDIIHANDQLMLSVGARAATRAKAAGRDVKLVWDAHEFVPGVVRPSAHRRWHDAHMALEAQFAPYADAVVTVSETVGEMLVEEHGLGERPAIVLNAPSSGEVKGDGSSPDIRALCGLGPDVPLLVYSGGSDVQRGLGLMVEALPLLPAAHVVFVVYNVASPSVVKLWDRAVRLGVGDRLHILPYVPIEDIVPFLATADLGVIPIHDTVNHGISLITKFFEYSHARLPILVSDVKTMAAMVRQTGQGEVFVAEDLDSYVVGVNKILADRDSYVSAYDKPGLLEEWTWEKQADVLDGVYSRLLEQG